ncbi:MAG: TetR/AcrR family transcriptional regulator [Isosphaeraceae bacterium]|nr:TetR/AcrR family transcriptional regulator [Isosphaeraceae bacterium]
MESKVDEPSGPHACARREEILDAATLLFAEQGYDATGTQDLAEKLQVGKGTLYRYFPSKRDLFLAAVDRVMRRLRASVDAAIEGIEEPLERIERAVYTYLDFFASHPEYVELLIQERAQFKDRKAPTWITHRNNSVERWRTIYGGLIAAGRLREMPVERITDVLSDLLYGTMFTNYFAGQRKPSREQAHDILDIIYHGILSDSERLQHAARRPSGLVLDQGGKD